MAAIAREALLETAIFEVILDLLLGIRRQIGTLRHPVRLERRVVFHNELINEGAYRAMARIHRRADTRAGIPASRQRQHARIVARLV